MITGPVAISGQA